MLMHNLNVITTTKMAQKRSNTEFVPCNAIYYVLKTPSENWCSLHGEEESEKRIKISRSFPDRPFLFDKIRTNILCEDSLKRVKNWILWFHYQQINNNHERDQPFQIFHDGNVTISFCHLDVHEPISRRWWIRWLRRLWWLWTLPAGEKSFHPSASLSTSIQTCPGVQETSLRWTLRWTLWWLWKMKMFYDTITFGKLF